MYAWRIPRRYQNTVPVYFTSVRNVFKKYMTIPRKGFVALDADKK